MYARARLNVVGWDADLEIERYAEAPQPAADQVVVRVHACGVAQRDVIDRSGRVAFMQVPITPGHEAAGVVEAVGAGVTQWQVGDHVATMHRDSCGTCPVCVAGETSLCETAFWVFGLMVDGGYASHLVCPERALYRLPTTMPLAHGAILLSAWGTAWRGLHKFGRLQAGARVLVTGANGGVGSAAVQLASKLGAHVVAVVRGERHVPFVESMGAERVIVADGRFDTGAWKADVVLECVGAATFTSALRSLRLGGGLVAIGNIDDKKVSLSIGRVILMGARIAGSSGATRADMADLLAFAAAQGLNFVIHETMPLAQADQAMRKVRAGGLQGRVVLDCLQ
jgi:acryloyl-coenzyme A reductase